VIGFHLGLTGGDRKDPAIYRVTSSERAGKWLIWMRVAIGNCKVFLLGTYREVLSKYLQEYLNEYCYRFNRRECEVELSLQPLNACLSHAQAKLKIIWKHVISW
jgi:hypothetical protein